MASILVLPSKAVDTTAYTFNNGQDLVIGHMDGTYGVVLTDWQNSNHRIETFVFDDGIKDYSDVARLIYQYAKDYPDSYPENNHGIPLVQLILT